ncbi:hypothetical protein GXM_08425 [Nostoc sphaeroides CCNUC1]|uniref:Uncharacterized protein n=1 Tax=Nostoc sphaeroides CCNUC1 TaxID=2653204 RepID=A0A5P8WED1_9NOSO|nr:hypothetical protein GXM_08425 [Nostoc sphaeroides CCNUC1]
MLKVGKLAPQPTSQFCAWELGIREIRGIINAQCPSIVLSVEPPIGFGIFPSATVRAKRPANGTGTVLLHT